MSVAATTRIETTMRAFGEAIGQQLPVGHQVRIIHSYDSVYDLHVTRDGVDAAAVVPLEGRAIVSPADVAELAATLAPRLSATLDLAAEQLAIADAVEKAPSAA